MSILGLDKLKLKMNLIMKDKIKSIEYQPEMLMILLQFQL